MSDLNLIPQPRSTVRTDGRWRVSGSPGLAAGPGLEGPAALLAGYLRGENGVEARAASPGGCDLQLILNRSARPLPPRLAAAGFQDESYRLVVEPAGVRIEAATRSGLAMGIQTLRQLLAGQRGRLELPGLVIEDDPDLGWRGLHLDVSRHFFDAAAVRRFIDLAALHKFNLFHWHLTDDQGWRLPVAGYPRLTKVGAWREASLIGHQDQPAPEAYDGIPHGGCYTVAEVRDLVDYAAVRGVQILPEVDVPGHVQALVTAYPEFGNTGAAPGLRRRWGISTTTLNLEPATFAFLETLTGVLTDLFPFRYLHFGGDEALTDEWAASPRIQQRKRELGLADEPAVQGYFTRFMMAQAARHGRVMIGWDEIIAHDDPPPEVAVMVWRDCGYNLFPPPHLKALAAGHPVVLAPLSVGYFDAYQAPGGAASGEPLAIGGCTPWEKVHAWSPLADIPVEHRSLLLGAQAQLWTEYIGTRDQLDYMTYPRACALAEVLWTGAERAPADRFRARLAAHANRLAGLGVAGRPVG